MEEATGKEEVTKSAEKAGKIPCLLSCLKGIGVVQWDVGQAVVYLLRVLLNLFRVLSLNQMNAMRVGSVLQILLISMNCTTVVNIMIGKS